MLLGQLSMRNKSASQEIERIEKDGKSFLKRVRGCMGMVVSQDSHTLSLLHWSLTAPLFVIHQLHHELHGVVAASLSSLPFLCQSPSIFLLTLNTISDNETTS